MGLLNFGTAGKVWLVGTIFLLGDKSVKPISKGLVLYYGR